VNQAEATRYKYKALIITGLGTFLGTFDASVVNVSLPTISRELNSSVNIVGWVVLAYALTVISLLMVFGALAEKKGFQFSCRYGFGIFFLGSLTCGLAPNIYFLIGSRALQGLGAAMLIAVGPALVTKSFPDNERGRGLSIIAMVVSAGLLSGPPLGGMIIEAIGWRWVFWVNLPVCLLGFYLTGKYLKNFPISAPDKKISWPGAATLSLGLLLLMVSVMVFSRQGLPWALMVGGIILALTFLAAFVYFENKPQTQLIGLDIFKNRVFSFSAAALLMVFISLSSVTVLMPFYLEQIKGFSPRDVGLYLMINPVCLLLMAPLAGYLADRFQARIISTIGTAIMAGGIYLIRLLNGDSSASDIMLVLAVMGIGMGFFSTPNTSTIMGSVPKRKLGSASGINATIRSLGISLGVALALALFEFYRIRFENSGLPAGQAFVEGFRSVYKYIIFIILAAMLFSFVRGKIVLGSESDHGND